TLPSFPTRRSSNLVNNVQVRGDQMRQGFEKLKEKYAKIADVRSMGLLGGISFYRERDEVTPVSPEIVKEALKRGSICRAVVYGGQDTLAFAPPFIITEEQMKDMLDIVDASIAAVLDNA